MEDLKAQRGQQRLIQQGKEDLIIQQPLVTH